MRFTQYLALGDSASIDLYPALDLGLADVAVALERVNEAGAVAPVGAASLFHRNDDIVWPEDAGADLVSQFPGITCRILAEDGATIGDVFGEQLAQLEEDYEPTIVTVTVGSNDLLSAFSNRPNHHLLERIVRDIGDAYELLVGAIRGVRPNAALLLTTLYDPSDGTASIPGVLQGAGTLPLDMLDAFNARIRTVASVTPGAIVADVHAHFLTHGVTAPERERWYWRRAKLEPNARGASEIRHVWLAALAELQEGEDGG